MSEGVGHCEHSKTCESCRDAYWAGYDHAIDVIKQPDVRCAKHKADKLALLDEIGNIVLKHTTQMPALILKIANEINAIRKRIEGE